MNIRKYYPTLRTRTAELLALRELTDERKDLITPLLTFGKTRKDIASIEENLEEIEKSFHDRSYILDLTLDKAHLDPELTYLRDPADNYKTWRDLVKLHPISTPCVVQSDIQNPRAFIRQALMLEQEHGSIAFRIRNLIHEPTLVVNALHAIRNIDNIIVFIDPGYIRNSYEDYCTAVISAIRVLRTNYPELEICVLSSTFPPEFGPYSENPEGTWGLIPLLEHTFYEDVGGDGVAIYGDHSCVHAAIYKERGGGWIPRIDYPRLEESYFERRRFDQGAAKPYIEAAKKIVEICPEISEESDIWGISKIRDAASGDLFAKNPGSWISVRVNIHLSRQIDYWNGTEVDQQKNFDNEFEEHLLE